MKRKITITVLIITAALTAAFIFSNSLTPGEESNAASRSLSGLILKLIDPGGKIDRDFFHKIIRKTAHFCEFALLGAELGALAAAIKGRITGAIIFMPLFFTLSTAVADEFLQTFMTRTSSVTDVLIDFAGGAAGIAFIAVLHGIVRLINKHKKGRAA